MPERKRRPKKLSESERLKLRFAEGLTGIIRLIAIVLLLISGCIIINNYLLLAVWSVQPSALIQSQINFSIQIFIGSGLYLILYSYETEELVKWMLNVSDRKLYIKQDKG